MSTDETMNTTMGEDADEETFYRLVCADPDDPDALIEHSCVVVQDERAGKGREYLAMDLTEGSRKDAHGSSHERAVLRLALVSRWHLREVVWEGDCANDELVRALGAVERETLRGVLRRCKAALAAAEAECAAAEHPIDPVLAARVEGMREMFQAVIPSPSGDGMAGAVVLAGRSLVNLAAAR